MREISRFLTFFLLFLTVVLGFGAAFMLYSLLTDRSSHLSEPVDVMLRMGSGGVLLGCVLAALRLIQKLKE